MSNNSSFEKLIPSLVTAFSLYFGLVAAVALMDQNYKTAAIAAFIGMFSDMSDDYFAKIFGTTSKFSEEFDYFSDLIIGGVVPGMVMYSLFLNYSPDSKLFYLSGLIPVFTAIRLSRLKSTTESSENFRGLHVNGCSLFIVGLPFLKELPVDFIFTPIGLGSVCIFVCFLMNSSLRLLDIKAPSNLSKDWHIPVLGVVAAGSIFAIGLGGITLTVLFHIILSLFLNPKKS